MTAEVMSVHGHTGERVEAGDLLVMLESRELSSQVAAAQMRLEAAAAHLRAARSAGRSARDEALSQEQMRSAERSRDMARQRLDALRVSELEDAATEADLRLDEIRSLLRRGLATDAELRAFQARQSDAQRELASVREHRSRLTQELGEADSRVRLLEIQASGAPDTSASAEADYADAKAAFDAAQRRLDSLCVTAPSRGTILSVNVQPGDRIAAGGLLVRIADLANLTISAPVTPSVARRIKVGRPVIVLLPGEPPRRTAATIHEVSLTPDASQQSYLIKTVIPNPDPETVLVGLEAQLELDHTDAL
jgi:HlyD family secretion protein